MWWALWPVGLICVLLIAAALAWCCWPSRACDPQLDPRATQYAQTARCDNCHLLLTFWIPKGKTVNQAQVTQVCSRCGCGVVLRRVYPSGGVS